MPDRTSYHSLLDAVERYFDLMFDSEVSRFDRVFASSAQLQQAYLFTIAFQGYAEHRFALPRIGSAYQAHIAILLQIHSAR